MKPLFHPSLVNDPFGDPGVYVDCLFEKRAVLFDLGDIRALPARKVLRLTEVFVSHTHMDHFMGFDWLLRICLGRERRLRLFGPLGFLSQVEHRLAAYTWNLVQSYETDFTLEVTEVLDAKSANCAEFHCRSGFRREQERAVSLVDDVLFSDESFVIHFAILDHKIPCLAFALQENEHLNVWKNELDAMGLPTGPWLAGFKHAVRQGEPEDKPIRVAWHDSRGGHEHVYSLGELKRRALRIVPGQRIAYVTDIQGSAENTERVVALAKGADYLFIEAPFLARDGERAADRYHLTARQAGELARRAGVRAVIPFHFSPAYTDEESLLRAEVMQAFAQTG